MEGDVILGLFIIALFLWLLALLVFGLLGLVRLSLAGVRSRNWVVMIYFGGALVCLLAMIAIYPDSPSGLLGDASFNNTLSYLFGA